MANETVGIDVVARLDAFRSELAKIPEIGGKEARQLTAALSREIKQAERASRSAADASKTTARAFRDQATASVAAARAVQQQGSALSRLGGSLLKSQISFGLLSRGMHLASRGLRETFEHAMEMDDVLGGDLAPTVYGLRDAAVELWEQGVAPLIPAFRDAAGTAGLLLDQMRESGAVADFARNLSDVAQGAMLATRAFFGLDAAQRQARAATDEANSAIDRADAKIVKLEGELRDLQAFVPLTTDPIVVGQFEARLEAKRQEISRAKDVLLRLRGELAPELAGAAGPAFRRGEAGGEKSGAIGGGGGGGSASAAGRKSRGAAAWLEGLKDAAEEAAKITEDREARIDDIERARHASEMARIEEERAARKQAAEDWLNTTSNVAGAIGGLVGDVANIVAESEQATTRERRKALKAAWTAQAVTAIATAAINIPLSISQASAAPWPASIGFMVAAGIASGAALAGVIAKAAAGPKFHAGGMIPDAGGRGEVQVTALPREAVLSRQGVAAAGGEGGVRRLNAGEDRGAQTVTVVARYGHRVLDVSVHEAIRSRRGSLVGALRAIQPRLGVYSPWGG